MFAPSVIPQSRTSRALSLVASAAALVAVIVSGGVVAAPPATAAAAALSVQKTVDGSDAGAYQPGDNFTYTITVGCDDADCVDAELTDPIPGEFAGFELVNLRVLPSSKPATATVAGCESTITDDCVLRAQFLQQLDGDRVGIAAGQTYELSLTLQVPLELPPTWASNGVAVRNTATVTSSTAETASDSADVTISIDQIADVEVSKTWEPASQQYQPGVVSTVRLDVRNASNVDAQSLILQDPKVADDQAADLAESNPFRIVDFVGFGAVTAPQGASLLAVDAYVYNAGSWTWVNGDPRAASEPALPAGVAPHHVAGLRYTFSGADGAVLAADGAAGTVTFQVAQRETDRSSDDGLVLGAVATNEVAATVTAPDLQPVTKSASAPYQIGGLDVKVEAVKTITPARIPAGGNADAVLGAKNASNGPLSTLTISDTDYFTEHLRFGGFTAPLAYPTGATSGEVTWYYSDGAPTITPFTTGETPVAPAAPEGSHLTGFAIAYAGSIERGAVVEAPFRIDTAVALVPSEERSPVDVPNTVAVKGENPAGSAQAEATAPLRVFFPHISLELDKRISPTGAVTAGGTVVVQLPTKTSTDSAYVVPTRIVVEDSWREDKANDFWEAFTPSALAPTQLLSGSSLTLEAQLPDHTWQTVTVFEASETTRIVAGELSDLAPGIDFAAVTGLRFVFENLDGFAAGTTVAPASVYQARSTQRGGGEPTAVAGGDRVAYENLAVASGTGLVQGGTTVTSDDVTDIADAHITAYDGNGSVRVDKTWTPATLPSQSGQAASSRLTWGVTSSGYQSVTIADPAGGETTPADTVFQAFDLTQIRPVDDSRWRWDTIQTLELYMDGDWQVVPAPDGGWISGTRFVGYTLSEDQSAAATGMRITVVPNDAARAASEDPLRPGVGSGVTTNADGDWRAFHLNWRLRNMVREPGDASPWTTGNRVFNDDGDAPGTVWNTVRATGVRGGEQHVAEDRANVVLVDYEPAVTVTKTVDRPTVPIPVAADVPHDRYPLLTYTVTAKNNSSARASYIRVTDPMPCTDATVKDCELPADGWGSDPFAAAEYHPGSNPFEQVDLTRIAFQLPNGSGVDTSASQVTLWLRDAAGALSTRVLSIAEAATLTAPALVDVVGVSVLYQGADPATAGGSIATGAALTMKLDTRLRVTKRSDVDAPVTPGIVPNATFAQSFDPVLFPDAVAYDTADVGVRLVDGVLDVTAAKTISPSSLLEKDRALPVKVALEATDGDATVATQEVVIEDVDPDFWSRFRLISLDSVQAPQGADQVRVDVQHNGEWVTGTDGATAVLPTVPLEEITGLRLVFTRADGGVFSRTAPPEGWTARANLTFALLDAVRDTGEEIAFPSTVSNDITTRSSRADADTYPAVEDAASDDIALLTGTYALSVEKTPLDNRHTVEAGQTVPWTLRFTNTGSGYLTVDQLVDTLPVSLDVDFSEDPIYSSSEGGLLSLEPTYDYDAATRELSFTWPEGSTRMAPGESYSITLGIVLKPGLRQGERATNGFVVTTVQPLSACTNTSGNGQGVQPGRAENSCGTTNYVEPVPGASLAVYKGVKGEVNGELVDGAVHTTNAAGSCFADAEGYYRTPCAALTVLGATDAWKLETVNSGTDPYTSLDVAEPLPVPGDVMLATGSTRGSTFRPIFDGEAGLQIDAPEGTTVLWQVTTGDNPCVGPNGRAWRDDPTCSADSWTDASAFSGDWSEVTGLRVRFDFRTTADGVLAPGAGVTVRYQTVNAPATEDDPSRGPIEVPVEDEFAWNQFGAHAVLQSGRTLDRAPVKAGVTLVSGELDVAKVVDGSAAAYAPADFLIDVTCSAAGVALDLGSQATLSVSPDAPATVTGIPLGAECTLDEQGEVGQFGETRRSGLPATVRILQPGDAPDAQAVTVTNSYDFGSLTISKAVDTRATVGAFGPFDFELSCTTSTGRTVELAEADRAFTLTADESRTITAGTLPVGSTCDLKEIDSDGAASVSITGDGVEDAGSGIAQVSIGAESQVLVTNRYEAGRLSVLKTVTGNGAGTYGDGPFAARVVCTYAGDTVFTDEALAIAPDLVTQVHAVFPVGTVCQVSETQTGGASQHTDPPAVTITGPGDEETLGAVTAVITNDFRAGELTIEKKRGGDGVAEFGSGPFQAQVSCTWNKDGQTLTVPLADGGLVTLDEAGEYRATVADIIVGARCSVTETDAGLATQVTMAPSDGTVTILELAEGVQPATVVIVNRFDVGQLEIEKVAESRVAQVGDEVTYLITVRNAGQILADDVLVSDLLPEGAVLVDTEGTADGRTIRWTIPTIEVGEVAELSVTVRYDAAGEYVNSAAVSNPAGPWRPVEVDAACTDDVTRSCAPVTVEAPPQPEPTPPGVPAPGDGEPGGGDSGDGTGDSGAGGDADPDAHADNGGGVAQGDLAATGGSASIPLAIGIALLALGAVTMAAVRRRRHRSQ